MRGVRYVDQAISAGSSFQSRLSYFTSRSHHTSTPCHHHLPAIVIGSGKASPPHSQQPKPIQRHT